MFRLLVFILFVPSAFSFSIHLLPPGEFSKAPAEELPPRMNAGELTVEDFEDDQLVEGLRATLSPSTNPATAPNAWDGKVGSKEVDGALFEFAHPGVRFFGVGIADNDGGGETLSINGGWYINLNSFPNHKANGQGKAYYLVVIAGENDPDLRTVSIANGFTIVFDHLVFGRGATKQIPAQPERRLPVVSLGPGDWRIRDMAERIQQQQRSFEPNPTLQAPRREGELIVNGGFDQIGTENGDGLHGVFGETMFAQGSTRLKGWTIVDAVVGLRDNPSSPAGIPILELGPRDEPGSISQRIKTEPGKEYELSFLVAGGRNNQLSASVAGKKETIECPEASNFKRVKIPFRATGAETEILLSGIGNQGFGPMIDDVSVVPVKSE